MDECARQAKFHNVRNTTQTEMKVKATTLNLTTFCFDRGSKRLTPLKGNVKLLKIFLTRS